MIHSTKEYFITCTKCYKYLNHPADYALVTLRDHIVKEDSIGNIKAVALSYGWHIDDNVHLCKKCKD